VKRLKTALKSKEVSVNRQKAALKSKEVSVKCQKAALKSREEADLFILKEKLRYLSAFTQNSTNMRSLNAFT
jgi:predicted unusual protein kinase regulating ubiquinone biosynthesis (AarF/ABC1/UbiB family)